MKRAFGKFHIEMNTCVRLSLSYDPLKLDFIAFKMENISRRKGIADTDIANNVTSTRQSVFHVR